MSKLSEKLQAIQTELKAPKGQYNSFGKYNYRSCEDIMESLKPVMAKHKVSLVISDEVVAVADRVYVKAVATLFDSESDETITASAYARESATKKGMDDSQITGATSSYARKYCLNGMFCIDDTKDADATNTHDTEPEPQKITDIQVKTLESLIKKKGAKAEKMCAYYKVKKLSDLTVTQFAQAMKQLESQADAKPVDLNLGGK